MRRIVCKAGQRYLVRPERPFDRDAVDKNYDVLCYLRDFKLPGFAAKISRA